MRSCLLGLVFLVAMDSLAAQVPIWSARGSGDDALRSARSLRDINGDGVRDVLVLVDHKPTGSSAWDERIWFLSGVDGTLLRVRPGRNYFQGEGYQRAVSAGDMDADGVGDYAVLTGDNTTGTLLPIVQVCSGRDDTVLWQVRGSAQELFGQSLLGDLDVDGDARPDLVLTTPKAKPYGGVRAYSNTGQLLWAITTNENLVVGFRQRPYDLGKMGDLDGDGCDDVVVSSGRHYIPGAAVLSGKDGTMLVLGLGDSPNDAFGDCNDGCGDMDGDGVLDFGSGQFNTGAPGGARVWSGATAQPIWTWRSDRWQNEFGRIVSSKGLDVDRDGVPDIGVGEPDLDFPGTGSGVIYLFSGRDGGEILRLVPQLLQNPNAGNLGSDFELVPPQGSDPFPLLLSRDWGAFPGSPETCNVYPQCGRVALFRLNPPGVSTFASACQGTLATTPQIGVQGLPGKTRIHLAGGEPGGSAVLLVGFSRTSWAGLSLPAALPGFPGCQLLVSPDAVVLVSVETGRRAGYAGVDLPLPLAAPQLASVTLHGQWIAFGNGATAAGGTSEGLAWQH